MKVAASGEDPKTMSVRDILLLCLPTLLVSGLFLLSFPIDRKIGPLTVLGIYYVYFLYVAPVLTATAVVVLAKRTFKNELRLVSGLLTWLIAGVTVMINCFVGLGLWAAVWF